MWFVDYMPIITSRVYVQLYDVLYFSAILKHPYQHTHSDFLYVLYFQSSYGFIDYFDRRSAALAIMTLNGRHL